MNRALLDFDLRSWRYYLVLSFFFLIVIVLCARIIFLGEIDNVFLQEQGNKVSEVEVTIPAARGSILDRHGEVLAVSTPGYSISFNPRSTTFTSEELIEIAGILEVDRRQLRKRLTRVKERSFVFVQRRVSRAAAKALRATQIGGLKYDSEYHRYYPAAETAAHVVGKTNVDGLGIEGVELSLDAALTGQLGRKKILRDRKGRLVRNLDYKAIPKSGRDIRLSIDLNLQFIAYRELKSAVKSHKAESGSLVMVDVVNGEILAMVNQPSYNPNEVVSSLNMGALRNRAVTDAFEPGSTIKPFVALAALESDVFTSESSVDTSPGFIKVSGHRVSDPKNYGLLSLPKIIQHSSNVGIAKVALRLPEGSVYDVLSLSGLGELVGVELPGESRGILSSKKLNIPIERASLAFGYGLMVTPLQLANAYLTIASGGKKLPMTILRKKEELVHQQLFEPENVQKVVEMMELVTAVGGTGRSGALKDYRVAGKTGTAQRLNAGRYDADSHNVWFAGIVPASDPRLLIVISVNNPQAGVSGGGTVAAPIFAQVARHSLRILGVRPDATSILLSQNFM